MNNNNHNDGNSSRVSAKKLYLLVDMILEPASERVRMFLVQLWWP